MSKVWQHIYAGLKDNKNCALISVIKISGSTPREVGARIFLNDAGGFVGTIGGGNLENNAIATAQKMLDEARAKTHTQKHLLGPDMGQCCGGAVTILIEAFTPAELQIVEPLMQAEKLGEFTTTGKITDQTVIRNLNQDVKTDHQLFETFGQNSLPIYIFGAGHVGKALMLQLANLPFQVTWVDSRKGEFPKAVPANFELICLNQPHKILEQAPDNAQIFILTHDHDLDFEIVSTALQMNRFAYVGMIGSKTKKARFVSKLRKLGLAEFQITQMICPIGLPSIKSKKPQAIAISVIAEMLTRIEI